MIPVVVLASGRGSNFAAIQNAVENQLLSAEIRAVISDQPQAGVLEKAQQKGIPAICIPFLDSKTGLSFETRRLEHELLLLSELHKFQPVFLILAGYRRIITPQLIEAFRCERGYSRMVNIHPSLLPAFPGLNGYSQAFYYGAKTTGVTVHFVESQVDSGPICAQKAFSIEDCESLEEVEKRGLAIEHQLFPEVLKWILPEEFRIHFRVAGRLCVRQN